MSASVTVLLDAGPDQLPERFQRLLDPSVTPNAVRFISYQPSPGLFAWIVGFLSLPFVVLPLIELGRWLLGQQVRFDESFVILYVVGAIFVGPLVWHFWRERRRAALERAGTLRLGLFLTDDALLWRPAEGTCHLVPRGGLRAVQLVAGFTRRRVVLRAYRLIGVDRWRVDVPDDGMPVAATVAALAAWEPGLPFEVDDGLDRLWQSVRPD